MLYTEWKPFIRVDTGGQPTGFNIEIIRVLVEDMLGRKLTYRQVPWKRVQKEVERGNADMFSGIPTTERKSIYLIGDQPLFAVEAPVYTRAGHPRLAEIRQVETVKDVLTMKLRAIAVLGNGWHEQHVEGVGVPTMTVTSAESVYQALVAGRGDLVIDLQLSTNRTQNRHIPAQGVIDTGVVLQKLAAHLILSRQSDHGITTDAMDKALARMWADGVVDDIFDQYLGTVARH